MYSIFKEMAVFYTVTWKETICLPEHFRYFWKETLTEQAVEASVLFPSAFFVLGGQY
jgi:hypothetical protein